MHDVHGLSTKEIKKHIYMYLDEYGREFDEYMEDKRVKELREEMYS